MSLLGYLYKLKTSLRYEKKEFFQILLASLIFGIILGFDEWGYGDIVDINIGLYNTIRYLILAFLAIILIRTTQKMVALAYGYEATAEISPLSLLISLLLTIITLGKIPFMFSGNLFFKSHKIFRVGKFRQLYMNHELGISVLAGIIPFLVLAIFKDFKLFKDLSWIMGLILLFTWLPIPNQDGMMLLFYFGPIFYIIFMIGFIVLLFTYRYSFLVGLLSSIITISLTIYYIETTKKK